MSNRLLDRDERGKVSQGGIYESKTPFMILVCEAQDAKSIGVDRYAMAEWLDDWYHSSHDNVGRGTISWQDVYDRAVDMLYKGRAPWDES